MDRRTKAALTEVGLAVSMLAALGLGVTQLVSWGDRNTTPNGIAASTHYISSKRLTAALRPNGILESRYEVVVDTSIPDNPYAKGEVALEFWIGNTKIRQARGSWDITGYPVKPNSTYTYVCLWPCNVSGLEQAEELGLMRVVSTDPKKVDLSTEARPDTRD